ncbi:MAG: hypothetical protein ACREET_04780 [Stellaceae bacterium]
MANSIPPNLTARPGEAIRVFRTADGSFAIGAGRIAVAGGDMRFVAGVVADLGRIVHGAAGEAVLREGDALGRKLIITKPVTPTEPRNAWVLPDDLAAATPAGIAIDHVGDGGSRRGTGAGSGSTLVYDPADWPPHGGRGLPASADVLLLMLRQANRNAAGTSDPGKPDWGDGI